MSLSNRLGLLGRKVGMMRVFTDDGDAIPVTVLDVSNNRVAQVKTVENPEPTAHPRIMKAHEAHMDWQTLQAHLATLRQAAEADQPEAIKAVLTTCVQGYQPTTHS